MTVCRKIACRYSRETRGTCEKSGRGKTVSRLKLGRLKIEVPNSSAFSLLTMPVAHIVLVSLTLQKHEGLPRHEPQAFL